MEVICERSIFSTRRCRCRLDFCERPRSSSLQLQSDLREINLHPSHHVEVVFKDVERDQRHDVDYLSLGESQPVKLLGGAVTVLQPPGLSRISRQFRSWNQKRDLRGWP